MEVHPAAQIFPLMGQKELESLAEDIKANGLRQSVVLTADGKLLDGRNRLAACKLAGVEPTTVSSNGDDPVALVVSLNVKRRSMTAGQRAVSAAEAWPLIGNNANKRASTDRYKILTGMFDVSQKYVQQARAIVEHAPDLAGQVKSGLMTMTAALEELGTREREVREREEEAARRETVKQRMRDEHADLLEAMERDEMDIVEAMAKVAEREEAARVAALDEEQSRRVLTESLGRAVEILQLRTSEGAVRSDYERLLPEALPRTWSRESVGHAVTYLGLLYEVMGEENVPT
jgi:hypothetical protein